MCIKTGKGRIGRIPGALLLLVLIPMCGAADKKPATKAEQMPSLEQYITEVNRNVRQTSIAAPGSIFTGAGILADSMRDLRASRVYDLVHIVVAESSSAVTQGTTNTDRKSSVNNTISSLLGQKSATGALANLAVMAGETQLQGTGTTSRTNTLTTTLTAEVIAVLPNGNLVVQGQKEILVNSERQMVTVRGIVRPDDLSAVNSVTSAQVARLEVHVNGKGVVEDAVRRPNVLYRILLGLLPF